MSDKKPVMYRQGDVLVVFQEVELPEGAKEVPLEQRGIVLAHGEVTGHAHVVVPDFIDAEGKVLVEPPVKYFDHDAERYLRALVDVTLRHEEHGAIVLKAGTYKQAFQVEDYGTERRAVAD